MNKKKVLMGVAIATVLTLTAMAFGTDLGESLAYCVSNPYDWGCWQSSF